MCFIGLAFPKNLMQYVGETSNGFIYLRLRFKTTSFNQHNKQIATKNPASSEEKPIERGIFFVCSISLINKIMKNEKMTDRITGYSENLFQN